MLVGFGPFFYVVWVSLPKFWVFVLISHFDIIFRHVQRGRRGVRECRSQSRILYILYAGFIELAVSIESG